MRWSVLCAQLCVGAFAVACTSLSGLSKAQDAGDVEPSDAGSDTTEMDSGGNDSGADGEAGLGYCATLTPQPYFCFDFDGPPLAGAFQDFTGVIKPTLDTTDPKSLPNALLFESAPMATASSSFLLAAVPSSDVFDVSLDLKVDATQLYAFELAFAGGPAPYRFVFYVGNATVYFAEKFGETITLSSALNPGLFPKSWTQFRFRVDFVAKTYVMWIGAGEVLNRTAAAEMHKGDSTFKFGAVNLEAGKGFSLRLDNLVIDLK